jgi:hypothetical protein
MIKICMKLFRFSHISNSSGIFMDLICPQNKATESGAYYKKGSIAYDADKIVNLVEESRNRINTNYGKVEIDVGESDDEGISDDGCFDLRGHVRTYDSECDVLL